MKILKYKVIGSLEDNYVEDDYWVENNYFGFEFDNGEIIVLTSTNNNFGDDSQGNTLTFKFLNKENDLNNDFYNNHLWTDKEVSSEMENLIRKLIDEKNLEWEGAGGIVEIYKT